MEKEKDNGVSNTTDSTDINNNVKEHANKENPYNLTGKAFENWKLNREFIAKKSRRITSTNFGDRPRTFLFDPEKIEFSEVEGSDGKTYQQMVYAVIEPAADPAQEVPLVTSSSRLVTKIARWIFEKRRYLLEIRKIGTGFSTDWEVDRAD